MHTHPYEHKRTNHIPRSIFEDWVQILKIHEVTTDASLPMRTSSTPECTDTFKS
jgi:hypothetical protein